MSKLISKGVIHKIIYTSQNSKDRHYPLYQEKFIMSDIPWISEKHPLNQTYININMKNPLNPLNQDKIIIEKILSKILSVKPLNPLNQGPLNRDSLCIFICYAKLNFYLYIQKKNYQIWIFEF